MRNRAVNEDPTAQIPYLYFFDYATGDILMPYEPEGHGMVGTCKYDVVSARKVIYSCDIWHHVSAMESGEEPCWIGRNILIS